MRKGRFTKVMLFSIVFSMFFSMTALAGEVQELTLQSIEMAENEEGLVEAAGHGTILPDPTMTFDNVYSNNTEISLLFNVRSYGVSMDYYVIRIYRGEEVKAENLVARSTSDFLEKPGSYNVTYNWDTTDVKEWTPGKYIIVCTSYYNSSTGDDTMNNTDSFQVTLEDYKLVLDREFVKRLYETALGREAEEDGLADWSNQLYNGTRTGATVVEGVFGSAEFANKKTTDEKYIELLYKAIFDREADEEGKAGWLEVLAGGMSRTYVLKQFIDSPEFTNLCEKYSIVKGTITTTENRDRNINVTGFVNRLYTIALDRTADAGGLNDWTGKLLAKTNSPQNVAYGFVFSPEMTARDLSNVDFVTMLYKTLIGREPDQDGLNDWVGRLSNGTSRTDVFWGFAYSTEFGQIIKSYGL